jgi:hypothetical protein
MSWRDKLQNVEFEIKTGDGKVFNPLWKNGSKEKEYNSTKYDFINVEGSFIDRKKPQSGKYPLVFWFQGDDNLEVSQQFEDSANDSRPWQIEHPFYGTLIGQPINLKRNDNNYNVTEITVDFWESITDDYPLSSLSTVDEVKSMVNNINLLNLKSLSENTKPKTSDITSVKEKSNISSSKFKPDQGSFNNYQNTIRKAVESADNIVVSPADSFRSLQEVINIPALFSITAKQRLKSYSEAFNTLKDEVESVFDKYYFESQAASLFCGMCLSSVTPLENEYSTRGDVESVSSLITNLYEQYLSIIDSNQVSINEIGSSWSPDLSIQSNLLSLINYTISQLFVISFNAKQERTYELKKDSNLIILTHRFMGLASDENLETFRKINNIKNDELFKIRKGRVVKFFV